MDDKFNDMMTNNEVDNKFEPIINENEKEKKFIKNEK